jgi:hypothetical protein
VLNRFLAAAAPALAAVSCVGPPVHFFADPPPGHAVFKAFSDTVLVVRHAPGDSVSPSGVMFAFDLLDRAEAAGETRAVRVVRRVLDAVPQEAQLRGEEPGAHDGEIYLRVQRQDLAQQFDMMRADVLVIRAVSADTVEVEVGKGEEAVVELWLALVLSGEAAANPAVGIR